jgi:hypothetical protein
LMQNKPNSGSLQDGTSKPGRGLALREKGDDRKESISTFSFLLTPFSWGHAEKSAQLVLAPIGVGATRVSPNRRRKQPCGPDGPAVQENPVPVRCVCVIPQPSRRPAPGSCHGEDSPRCPGDRSEPSCGEIAKRC